MPVHRLTSGGKHPCWGVASAMPRTVPRAVWALDKQSDGCGVPWGLERLEEGASPCPVPWPPMESGNLPGDHKEPLPGGERHPEGGRPSCQPEPRGGGPSPGLSGKRSPARCVLGPPHRGPQNKPSPADPRVPAGPVPPPRRPRRPPSLPYLPGQVRFCSKATDMAQSSILRRMKPDWAAASWIRSMNFSHTRGTPMCDVGSTSRSVFTRLPCPEPGREARSVPAQCQEAPTPRVPCPGAHTGAHTLAHAVFHAVGHRWAAVPAARPPPSPLSSLT